MSYPTKLAAVHSVLLEACESLNAAGLTYAIAGGWIPYLRCKVPGLSHPGTNDVDILLDDDPAIILCAVQQLLKAGYVPSAKHPFQLLKRLDVGNQPFIFNIDLMHPQEGTIDKSLFRNIMNLSAFENGNALTTHIIKSIALPSAQVILDHNLWSNFDIKGFVPDGRHIEISIPLMDERSLIISKARSADNIKRPRDAFDIFYTLKSPQSSEVVKQLNALRKQSPAVGESLKMLQKFITDKPRIFNKNIEEFAPDVLDGASQVEKILYLNEAV